MTRSGSAATTASAAAWSASTRTRADLASVALDCGFASTNGLARRFRALLARWPIDQAVAWHQRLPWLLGANFTPSTARNQLEIWQAATFDPATIDRELGWAATLGMTSMRVFLHDLCWRDDRAGFLNRIDSFLGLADRHGIGALLVLFDCCWHPYPRSGAQTLEEPGVHNSAWVQSPSAPTLRDPTRFRALEGYVSGLIGHFRDDRRIHGWDLWNEPGNSNPAAYGPRDLGERKSEIVEPLLAQTFRWARTARPTQPLTSGVWNGAWADALALTPVQRLQLHASDIIESVRASVPTDALTLSIST